MNHQTTHRIQLQPAYVLHQRPYRDTSRIVDLFTRDHGRLTVFARGVRGSKQGLAATLQAFQPILVSCSGKGEAGQLSAAELVGEPYALPAARMLSGFYLNELLLKLLHLHDPQTELFDLYNLTLQSLKAGIDELLTLRLFEKRLLHALGFGLLLRHEAESGLEIEPTACYRYVLELGPLPVTATANAAKGVYSGATLLALAAEVFTDSQQKIEVRYLLRSVLDYVLDGRRLQSREILGNLRQLRAKP
ncbi:MAG: DNA repair protein RecO [Steroidobacteraceae bacterium]